MFKVGDLVQMDNQFSPERHPPMGAYGIVIDVENMEASTHGYDGNRNTLELVEFDQYVRVHWAHSKNNDDQCYLDASLKKIVGV